MIIFLILIAVIWLISKKSENVRLWKEKIIRQPLNYYLLMGLLVVGFIFRLDYTFAHSVFSFENIESFLISMILVLFSFFAKKRIIKLVFMSLELLVGLYKLFMLNFAYFGLTELLVSEFSLYDTATLALRLFIINSLLKTSIKQIYVLICTVLVISINTLDFPARPFMFVTYDRGAETRDFLMGEWIENNDTEERTRIVFHPETAVFYNFQNYDSLLFHSWFSFPNGGALWETLNNYWFEITICRKGNDTININLFQRFAGCEVYYSTQMIRKIP